MNTRRYILFFSAAVASSFLNAQNHTRKAEANSNKIEHVLYLNRLSDSLSQQDPAEAKKLSSEALALSEELHNDTLIYSSRFKRGIANFYLANQNEALADFIKNRELAKKLKDRRRIIESDNAIGNAYKDIERYQPALDSYKEALSLDTSNPKAYLIYGNIATIHHQLGRHDSALYYCHYVLNKYKDAIKTNYQFLSNIFESMVTNYTYMRQEDSITKYLDTVLILKKKANDLIGYAGTLYNVAGYYKVQKDYARAETYLKQAAQSNPGNIELACEIEKYLGHVLYEEKKFEAAALAYWNAIALQDSLYKVQTIDKLGELEVKYETSKKEEELKRLEVEKQVDELQLKQSRSWLLIALVGGLFCIVVAVILYLQNKSRRRANKLLEEQNHEILTQKKEITDSINYAKRIQLSIQPPDNMVKRLLPDAFIFYKPKDVVSGDFYWLEERNGLVMFAAVDCTGHGVPGAMMSVVGLNLLNQAVNEKGMTVPADILQHLDKGVTDTLRQTSGTDSVKDGMDLSLCTLDPLTRQLQYAGAFNNLWIVRKNISTSYIPGSAAEVFFENDLLEIKADKFPIGSNLDGVADTYTNYTIQLQPGDCVYLYSDGFADQFGGPKGKKFKYNALKKLLISIHHLSPEAQKEALNKALMEWKGNLEQVDDILVIGVKMT